jgi:hypothetical protein
LQAASTRAGAYLSSWGAWASEKKKGWGASRSAASTPLSSPPQTAEFSRGDLSDKDTEVDGFVALSSAKTAPPDIARTPVDKVEKAVGEKRESVFFDAEKDRVVMTAEELLAKDAELLQRQMQMGRQSDDRTRPDETTEKATATTVTETKGEESPKDREAGVVVQKEAA